MPFTVADALTGVRVAMVEAAQKADRKRLQVLQAVSCSRGCSGCCSRRIVVSVAEATVILESLIAGGRWGEVRSRALLLREPATLANERSWFLMNLQCPVLDPGSRDCLAYGVRPTPCSSHFSTSNPELCDPWSTAGGAFRPVEAVEAHTEFLKRLSREVDGDGVLALRLPMPLALLLAERVRSNVRLTAEDVTSFLGQEVR